MAAAAVSLLGEGVTRMWPGVHWPRAVVVYEWPRPGHADTVEHRPG
ncbi:hypothetical protein [Streptomyces sp. NPDC002550]